MVKNRKSETNSVGYIMSTMLWHKIGNRVLTPGIAHTLCPLSYLREGAINLENILPRPKTINGADGNHCPSFCCYLLVGLVLFVI